MYRKSNLRIFLILLIVLSVGISIGYAYLNTSLTINGTSAVQKNTWDTHFDNIKIKEGSVTANIEPTVESGTKISRFDLVLQKPGDYYEFTVDVVNSGTLDAMVSNIVKTPDLTLAQQKYLDYKIEYENGEQITTKQLVKAEEFVRVKVRVEYKKDIQPEDLPTELDLVSLGFEINYEQADNGGVSVTDNGIFKVKPIANGDINEIGTIVTIGDQQFYTIGTEGENVKLLSMYNLYVGNECTSNSSSSCTPYGSEATGKQDSTMLGYVSGQSVIKGTTAFSSDTQKGTYYSYYNGSIVEGYVNAYKDILEGEEYGIDVVEARLITKEELTSNDIGCSEGDCRCSSAPSFIYSTSYWSESCSNSRYVWRVDSDGNFDGFSYYSTDFSLGVRPVIVISKSLF